MQGGTDGLDTAALAARARRAAIWAALSLVTPVLVVVYTFTGNRSHGTGNLAAWSCLIAVALILSSLLAVVEAAGAARGLRAGRFVDAVDQLGCAGACLTVPALLLSIPGVGLLGWSLWAYISVRQAIAAGTPGAGCGMVFVAGAAVLGGTAMLYVIPALIAATIARRVIRSLAARGQPATGE